MAVQEYQLIIGGTHQSADSGQTFSVLAPVDGRVLAQVARAGSADVELAVSAARQGFQQWSALAPGAREAVLLRAADIIASEGEARLLDTLIDESGSVITKARHEINYTVDLLRTAAGEVRRLYGDTFPNDRPERLSMVFREPLGVAAIVAPYNAPLSLLAKMTAFPLAAGNSVVIKPSEETPLTALAFAEVLLEAGVPAAAVSVVTGYGAECGECLVAHANIDCVALTGSTRTGVAVGAEAMKHIGRCQLERGGKRARLVLGAAAPVAGAAARGGTVLPSCIDVAGPAGSGPIVASSAIARSRTVVANGPPTSCEWESGTIPSMLDSPLVGRSPTRLL